MKLLVVLLSLVVMGCGGGGSDPAPEPVAVGRFVAINSETTLDTTTDISWTRHVSADTMNWTEANAYCAAIGEGWRLPTPTEGDHLAWDYTEFRWIADWFYAVDAGLFDFDSGQQIGYTSMWADDEPTKPSLHTSYVSNGLEYDPFNRQFTSSWMFGTISTPKALRTICVQPLP
jgi:hypothetical protein